MLRRSVLIAGAGAVGSVLGGMLHAGGTQVALLGRPPYLQAIAREGLQIAGLFGIRRIHGLELAANPGQLAGRRFDLIVLAVKSYDTAALAPLLSDLLNEGGIVLCAQNGLGNLEIVARHVPPSRLLGARVIFGAEITGPAAVRVTVSAEPVAIGPAPNLSGSATPDLETLARQIAELLIAAGIPAHATADIRPYLWTKVFYNAALNPLGALLKTHYGALGEDPGLRELMNCIIGEAFAVAQHLQIALPFVDTASYLDVFYNRLLPATFDHRPSMLVDLEQRGRTEIDALNGRVAQMAEALGLPAPANSTMTRLIKAAQRLRHSVAEEQK